MNVNAKDFEPRIGLAWRPISKTVVRSGFGISHTPFQDNVYADNYPVRQNVVYNPLNSYTVTLQADNVTPETLQTGFPQEPQPVIPASGIIPDASATSTWIIVNTAYRDPYVISYNLALERDLGHGWVGDAAYVGNVGRHIPGNYNLNAGQVAGAGASGQPEFATLGRTATTELLPRQTPFSYNSLQAKLTRRLSNNLIANSGYAWQKSLGYNSSTTSLGGYSFYLDFQRNYARTTWDRRQTFVQSVVYSLPFGKGQRFAPTGIGSMLVGGWQVSGLLSWDAGTPLLFEASASELNAPGTIQVPNQLAPFQRLKGIGTAHDWFNTSAFVQPTGAVLGNMGQNVYSGPGLLTFDSTLKRNFPIHDTVSLDLRMQAFNALNHPVFANPSTTLGGTSFGEVTSTLGDGGSSVGSRAVQFAASLHF